jgi:hypothetical protein
MKQCVIYIGSQSQFFVYQKVVAWATLIRASHGNGVGDIVWDKTGLLEGLFAGSGR